MIAKSLRTPPLLDKQSAPEDSPSRSRITAKQPPKPCCPACHQPSALLAYACCFALCCEQCYHSQHFLTCPQQFNKHTVPLASVPAEQNRKKNGKKGRTQERCRRCENYSEVLQHCEQCRSSMCSVCSQEVHGKGKFAMHSRTVGSSPEKRRRMDTLVSQIGEEEKLPDRKENMENVQYGYRAKERVVAKPNAVNANKKGRSIAKMPFTNQENTPQRRDRRRSMNQSIDFKVKQVQGGKVKVNEWQLCLNHGKLRTILTQNYDLLCVQCYEEIKTSVTKLKVLQLGWWLKNEEEKVCIMLQIQGIFHQVQLKNQQLSNDFRRYRQQLQSEYTKKCELLEQRYKTNVLGLQKWQRQYFQSLTKIKHKCEALIALKKSTVPAQTRFAYSQVKKQMDDIRQLQSSLLYQQIVKEKKQYSLQLQQFQFKVAEINTQQFQELIRSFYFARRRLDQEGQAGNPVKSLSKMSQSNQLRQSRISNSSLTTDRKFGKREESGIKSNYYQLSNGSNLLKRSISRQIRQDLTKDISQRVLFPVNPSNSDKKEIKYKIENNCKNHMRSSNYFFQGMPEDKSKLPPKCLKKDAQSPNFGLKDVKYINLETIITQKLQKGGDQPDRRDAMQMSTPNLTEDNLKQSIYLGEATEQPSQQISSASDHRMTYSIAIPASLSSLASKTIDSNGNPISANSSVHNAKNKRKSDYMQMRDRLRKPNIITKMGK